MYKLIVSDIDLTLINSEFILTDYNIEMINKAREAGIDFMLCTGRIFGSARPYAKHLNLNTPIITSNGAITMEWKDKKVLFENPIKPQLCDEIFKKLDDMDIYYHFYSKEVFYTRHFLHGGSYIEKMNLNLPEEERFKTLEVDNPTAVAYSDPVYKISIRCQKESEADSFRKAFENMKNIEITSSFSDNFEISAAGVNKGEAVKKYAALKGIPLDEIMAIGDNLNDIEMLECAGTGVAIGNAVDELKAAADYVTGTNDESGVGQIIAKLVFGIQEEQ